MDYITGTANPMRSRRNANLECFLFKKDRPLDNDLTKIDIYKECDAYFKAEFIGQKSSRAQDSGGILRHSVYQMTIKTYDYIEVSWDDKIVIDEELWTVSYVNENISKRSTKYRTIPYGSFLITLRK